MPQYQGIWTLQQQAQAQSNQQWVTDPNFKNTTLLLQADNFGTSTQNNTFLDSSTNNFTVTRAGNTTQGSFSPFSQAPGYWSNYFGGSQNITVASTNTIANALSNATSANLTVECWVYPTSLTGSSFSVIGTSTIWTKGNVYASLMVKSDGAIGYGYYNGSSHTYIAQSSAGAIALNTWSHVAIVFTDNLVTIYVNGTSVSTGTRVAIGSLANTELMVGFVAGYASTSWNGYISNFRVVTSAVYSSSFTPPTSPLSAIANTQFLTSQSNRFVDNSTGNSGNPWTITLSGTPSIQAFDPFAPALQWTPDVVGGSGYLPASGSYLTLPVNSAFAPGTGDYTVDGWVYTGSNTLQTIWAQTVSGTNYFVIEANAPSSVIQITSVASGGGTAITSAATLRLNAWNHFTVSRTSGVITVWCNGSAGTPTANTVNLTNITYIPTIGAYSHSTTTNVLIGYLSNLRYIKGTALSGATIPTVPNTAVTNTQALLNFTNAGIYDAAMGNDLQTVGSAQVSTNIVKYGSGSMFFNGTTSYLVNQDLSKQNFNFGTGDFTVEFWINTASLSVEQSIFDTQTLGGVASRTTSFVLVITTTGTFRIYTNSAYSSATTNSIVINTWNHIAMVRNNGIITIYVNGVSGLSFANTTNFSNSGCVIGKYADSAGGFLNGYLDDLRVTKGVARYYQNFLPPQVALPRQ